MCVCKWFIGCSICCISKLSRFEYCGRSDLEAVAFPSNQTLTVQTPLDAPTPFQLNLSSVLREVGPLPSALAVAKAGANPVLVWLVSLSFCPGHCRVANLAS